MKGPTYYGAMHFSDGADEDTEYFYDCNGNTVKDLNRGITSIEYDVNNLPVKVTFKDGSTISSVYDADGNKLSVTHHTALKSVKFPLSDIMPCDSMMLCDSIRTDLSDASFAARMPGDSTLHDMSPVLLERISEKTVTDYSGSFIYRNGTLDKILFDGGYITYSGGSATYHFYIQDHLGSTRAVVTHSGVVEQTTHYYPFGAINGAISTGFDVQPYKYNGKELDRTNGYDMMDYGARMYAADLGRWMVMDPLAEKYYDVSPYAYCHNNPVNRIDYKGLYDYENICGYTDYSVIAVFQSNRDKTLEYDYQIAKEMGMPIFVVDNIGDFKEALDDLALKGSTFQTITLNSHGSYGKFNIGDDTIDMTTDLSSLRENLEGRTIFVGACNVGDSYGCFMVEGLAEQTSSTVVAACHKISAGYRYDGGNGLNYYEGEFPYIMLPSVLKGNKYILSESGSESKSVRNVTIDKRAGISWEGYYLGNYGIFNNKFR